MFKKEFLQVVLFSALVAGAFPVPGVKAAIDETMPDSIPPEILADWQAQAQEKNETAESIKASLPDEYAAKCDGSFNSACHWRRVAKLKPYMSDVKKVLYAKHCNQGGPMVGFLSGLPVDHGSNWAIGSGLYILNMTDYYPKPEVLLEDAQGVIKDPCVSFDGKKVLFAWWKIGDAGGFHLFEIDVETKATRQITNNPLDLKVGDYEPCYLPTGDIMFSSSRSYGMVDCAYNTVGNMYLCNKNGDWLRKIGFDQEATFYPTMMSDGKVLYSRWEFNDRTFVSCGGYFTMNPDGTGQTEYWGNQSDFPLLKYHGREIPNSNGKIMGIAGDHLAPYQGEIIVVDPHIDRNNFIGNENESIKLVAPVRKAPVDPSTAMSPYSGIKYIFQNPWPFDVNNCLVSWCPNISTKIFKIYFFNADASRELMAWDSKMSVSQPVVMDPPPTKPPIPALQADYTKETGIFQLNNVYHGTGSKGVAEGKITKLRVIALDYRTNYSIGGCGMLGRSNNPIGAAYSSWMVKTLLGEIPVEKDGSACFIVPANTPVFFQTIDADGRMVNTMRSWSTLMPGERFACTGCHENKNETPPVNPIAKNPLPLVKRLGVEDKGFSFPKMVQPILDKYCIKCHDQTHKSLDLRANPVFNGAGRKTFNSSYSNLTQKQGKYTDWIPQETKAAPIAKFPAPGSGTSPLADTLLKNHNKVNLTPEEREVLFCWMDFMVPHAGTYYEGMEAADSAKYVTYLNDNRNKHIEWEKGNIKAFVDAGQWNNAIYTGGAAVSDHQYPDELKARNNAPGELRVIPFAGKLAVQCPGTGMISILNMKGRVLKTVDVNDVLKTVDVNDVMKTVDVNDVMKNVDVNDVMKNGKQLVLVPWTMPSGIYVVRFKSKNMARQRVVAYLTNR